MGRMNYKRRYCEILYLAEGVPSTPGLGGMDLFHPQYYGRLGLAWFRNLACQYKSQLVLNNSWVIEKKDLL